MMVNNILKSYHINMGLNDSLDEVEVSPNEIVVFYEHKNET